MQSNLHLAVTVLASTAKMGTAHSDRPLHPHHSMLTMGRYGAALQVFFARNGNGSAARISLDLKRLRQDLRKFPSGARQHQGSILSH